MSFTMRTKKLRPVLSHSGYKMKKWNPNKNTQNIENHILFT